MVFLLPVGLLLVITAVYLLIRWVAGRLRVPTVACPSCGHPVLGLVEPMCPECGGDLGTGVLAAGGIRPRPGLWLGLIAILLALIWTAVLPGLLDMSWNSMLNRAGQFKQVVELDRVVGVGIDLSNRLSVGTTAAYERQDVANATGEVQVTLSSDGKEIATWKGTGPVMDDFSRGVVIDGMDAIESLRRQIPPDSDSPFAPILHDPADASILAGTIADYAAPAGGVSSSVSDSGGHPMFRGGINTTSNNRMGTVPPSAIWFVPIYVIIGATFLGYLWLGIRILIDRSREQPFKPHVEVA